MLILVGILPGSYALDLHTAQSELPAVTRTLAEARRVAESHASSTKVAEPDSQKELNNFLRSVKEPATLQTWAALALVMHRVEERVNIAGPLTGLAEDVRKQLRTEIYLITSTIQELEKRHAMAAEDRGKLNASRVQLEHLTHFIPAWVKVAVAIALGLGTMIGWKRIVVTVGEKIGKVHLSYAQGACAEVVAMTTIGAADIFGLPVSTTHVLSSGVAGAMAANNSGLQKSTVRNLLLAWVLTLPVCVFLGALLFALGLNLLAGMQITR
jgi:PiT family inorganic phosphate transporter